MRRQSSWLETEAVYGATCTADPNLRGGTELVRGAQYEQRVRWAYIFGTVCTAKRESAAIAMTRLVGFNQTN